MGFTKESLAEGQQGFALNNPIPRHILRDEAIQIAAGQGKDSSESSAATIQARILAAQDLREVDRTVLWHVKDKMSKSTSLESESIPISVSISEPGLDSLLVIEFRNWILRAFQATLQSPEILDVPDLIRLVSRITEKSSLTSSEQRESEGNPAVSSSEARR